MARFVIDNSVVMRWILPTHNKRDQAYTNTILDSLSDCDALAPSLLLFEMNNVLQRAIKNKDIDWSDATNFICLVGSLPLEFSEPPNSRYQNEALVFAQKYNLSGYDASYLALAYLDGLPLSTLDKSLSSAAKKQGVVLFDAC